MKDTTCPTPTVGIPAALVAIAFMGAAAVWAGTSGPVGTDFGEVQMASDSAGAGISGDGIEQDDAVAAASSTQDAPNFGFDVSTAAGTHDRHLYPNYGVVVAADSDRLVVNFGSLA